MDLWFLFAPVSLFAQQLLEVTLAVIVRREAHRTAVALDPIATPAIGIVPVALEKMWKKQVFVIEAGLQREILFAADAAVGHLLVPLCARNTRNRREGATG